MAPEGLTENGDVAVLVRMCGLLPSLSAVERAIATTILDSPDRLGQLSISALATAANVSDTSITRFSRALGFTGYPGLRLAVCLAADRDRGEGFWVGADVAVVARDSISDLAAKVLQAETHALRDTLLQLDLEAVDAVAEFVAAARRVEVFAVGSSALVAADLEYKLRRLGIACTTSPDVHRALTDASHLGPSDVAVSISHSGRSREVLEPLQQAVSRKAATVAITHDPRSPIAQLSQHVLTTSGKEPAARSGATVSRIAQLFVIDCLYARLVQRLDPQVRESFDRADDLTRSHKA